jgi:DNA-binding NarL/FixJ family response regulator
MLDADGIDVVGEAADAASAVAEAVRLRPDIVLLDIQLPDRDGISVARQISVLPDPPVVVLISARDAATYGTRLASTPARGFIAKGELSGRSLTELVQ